VISNSNAEIEAQAPPPSSAEKYADETPAQRFDHREIAHRYREQKKQLSSGAAGFTNFRKGELERLYAERCGNTLPDNDAGRDYLRLMADHLAQRGEDCVRWWARDWAPWAGDDELDALIEDVTTPPTPMENGVTSTASGTRSINTLRRSRRWRGMPARDREAILHSEPASGSRGGQPQGRIRPA
jgi:hypothetical protein